MEKNRSKNSGTLLSPYERALFLDHPGWKSLSRILKSPGGGSFALSGPRGSGKSWAMRRALDRAKNRGGLGVWFPSPSEYEPLAFLSALSEHAAVEFEAFYDLTTGRSSRASRVRFFTMWLGGATLIYLALALLFASNIEGAANQRLPSFVTFLNLILAALLILGVAAMVYGYRRRRNDGEGLGRVRAKAEDLRRQVRFSVTATESGEIGLGAKYAGIGGALKRARERQLVERPATLSSLVHDFRAFVHAAALEVDGPVVIAIDELDKMSDADRVAQLLRDIKGIFEIPGACFLVSLSDEAAQALELGAVRARNEFNSSFYTVISMPALSPAAALELLRMRDPSFDGQSGRALGILTGGVSRELVRVAELVRLGSGSSLTLSNSVGVAMREEVNAFGFWVLGTAGSQNGLAALGDDARLSLFDVVEQASEQLSGGAGGMPALVNDNWNLNGANAVWTEHFAEEWRRLLVRLEVAGRMLRHPELVADDGEAERLQRVVEITAASAAVGRRYLDSKLQPVKG